MGGEVVLVAVAAAALWLGGHEIIRGGKWIGHKTSHVVHRVMRRKDSKPGPAVSQHSGLRSV